MTIMSNTVLLLLVTQDVDNEFKCISEILKHLKQNKTNRKTFDIYVSLLWVVSFPFFEMPTTRFAYPNFFPYLDVTDIFLSSQCFRRDKIYFTV